MSNLTFLFCAVCYSQYIIYLRTYFPCAGSDDAGHAPETGGDGAGHGSSDMDYTCSGEWVVLGGITYCLPPNIADLFRSWGIPMGEPNSVADLRAVFGKIWQNRMLDRPPRELAPLPRGNPGSATEIHFLLSSSTNSFMISVCCRGHGGKLRTPFLQ